MRSRQSNKPSVSIMGMTRYINNDGVMSLVSVSSLDVSKRERYRDREERD